MRKNGRRTGIVFSLILLIMLFACTGASAGEGLSFPNVTETDCVWDDQSNLVSETSHDPDGNPALNNRGFYRAEYRWDDHNNLLSEAYYGLNGEPVTIDKGYSSAEYTYWIDRNEISHILTEDRYAPDGTRADIPGQYSYRRAYSE